MRKLEKINLKNQGSVLQKDEMMKILGGGSAYCHCYGGDVIEMPTCDDCQKSCSGGAQNCNTY
jgi:hypothetical protein